MITRIGGALVLGFLFVSAASAQTVRFDTNVGTFDLDLNPTGNADLQGHVDNLLAYVNSRRYDLTVINRAVDGDNADPNDDFVLQMGGFLAGSSTLPANFSDFAAVSTFSPVIVDTNNDGTLNFDVSNLLNVRSTVSLALSTGPNTGTSSFFINLGTNTNLDAATLRFVPFAEISDMATVDLILGLNQANLPDGGLGGDDVPLLDDNRLVFLERVFVLPEPFVGPVPAATASAIATPPPAAVQALSVPEPPALVIAVGALMLLAALKRGKIGSG